jgi:hypothetical protein
MSLLDFKYCRRVNWSDDHACWRWAVENISTGRWARIATGGDRIRGPVYCFEDSYDSIMFGLACPSSAVDSFEPV